MTYLYDATTGRLNRITGPGLPGYGVEYTWHTDSDLVEYTDYKTDASTTVASSRRVYETDRDLVRYVANKAGSPLALVSKYDYLSDDVGRRTSVVYTGSAFGAEHLFKWDYNPRSELTDADRHEGTNPEEPGSQYGTNGDFAYVYDNIGNRDSYTLDGGTATTYTANELNQYTATANPAESFDYDDDGNLIADGTYDYTWDAENRLIRVEPSGTPQGGAWKLEFKYDYMGRRVERTLYEYDGGWVVWSRLRFVYDEWNVVLVLDGQNNNATLRKYTWGLDLSGQRAAGFTPAGIHGAGGIGGLLSAVETSGTYAGTYWFFYDANGNVGQLIENTTGYPIAAHYEYGPYGNLITATGTYANANPFRFSTKWHDWELPGHVLVYYGYRYYSPRLGRWLSRDPLGEVAFNLIAFGWRSSYVSAGSGHAVVNHTPSDVAHRLGMPLATSQQVGGVARTSRRPTRLEPPYTFLSNNPLNTIDGLGLETTLASPCECDREHRNCIRDKEDRHTECLARGLFGCGIMCAVRCPRKSDRCILVCMGGCMWPYTWACNRDLRIGKACCDRYKDWCEEHGSWPGWLTRRRICTFFH